MLRYEILQVRLDCLIIVSIAFSRLQYLEHDILGPLALLPFRSDFLTVENLELVSFEIFLTMNGELHCLLHWDFFLLHVLLDLKTHFVSGTHGDIYRGCLVTLRHGGPIQTGNPTTARSTGHTKTLAEHRSFSITSPSDVSHAF